MTKENKFKLLSLFVAFTPLSIVIVCGHINGKNYDKAIRHNSFITVGKVYEYEQLYKHTPTVKYEFEFDGVNFCSKSSPSAVDWTHWQDPYKRIFAEIKGKSFPVFVSKDDPAKYNKILITPEDFKVFNINYPDSLSWVRTLLDK